MIFTDVPSIKVMCPLAANPSTTRNFSSPSLHKPLVQLHQDLRTVFLSSMASKSECSCCKAPTVFIACSQALVSSIQLTTSFANQGAPPSPRLATFRNSFTAMGKRSSIMCSQRSTAATPWAQSPHPGSIIGFVEKLMLADSMPLVTPTQWLRHTASSMMRWHLANHLEPCDGMRVQREAGMHDRKPIHQKLDLGRIDGGQIHRHILHVAQKEVAVVLRCPSTRGIRTIQHKLEQLGGRGWQHPQLIVMSPSQRTSTLSASKL